MDIDQYETEAENNPYLKQYLDLNRFSLAIQYKLAGDLTTFKQYREKLDLRNLTTKQRQLLKQPRAILKALVKTKVLFEKIGFRLTSYT